MKHTITISEAAKTLGVHVDTLRDWDKKGVLKSIRATMHQHRRYLISDIDKFLHSRSDSLESATTPYADQGYYLAELEREFNVNYPINNSATYNSLVNYKQDLNTPFQRWCNYKEGYSLRLNELIFAYYGIEKGDNATILDPFSGSGSTLLAAKNFGLSSIGYEVNQFSHFFSVVKTRNYTIDDLKLVRKKLALYSTDNFWTTPSVVKLPDLSIAEKLFDEQTLADIYRLKDDIVRVSNKKVKDLLFFIWLSNLESLSNYRKAGNGLKVRKTVRKREQPSAKKEIITKLKMVLEDLSSEQAHHNPVPKIYNKSCKLLSSEIPKNSIRGVIFSPPYANCFDYTEIYKVELWFGEFVKKSEDLKKLRSETLRSHLNRRYDKDSKKDDLLKPIITRLSTKQLWSKRIPEMINGYFVDMREVLEQVYSVLEKGGFCTIVVSNSAYAGVVVPTDLLLSKISEDIGFKVSKIDVARYIITSSQQYNQTLEYRKYLRESVIYMEKN